MDVTVSWRRQRSLVVRLPEEEEVVEDEVDRKADEFIAKFREQIRMQRVVEPGRR